MGRLPVLCVVLCLSIAGAFAQSEAGVELHLQQEITAEYEAYLDEQELLMRALLAGGSDEESARMALVVILFAQLQVETDRATSASLTPEVTSAPTPTTSTICLPTRLPKRTSRARRISSTRSRTGSTPA